MSGEAWIAQGVPLLALWVRLAAFWWASPLASATKAPVTVSVLFTGILAVSLGLSWQLPPQRLGGAWPMAMIALMVMQEAMVGCLMGFALRAGVAAVSMAGHWIDMQAGLSMASMLDPAMRTHTTPLAALGTLLGVLVFFQMEGPEALVRALAFSAEGMPPGQWALKLSLPQLIRPMLAMASLTVVLAAPVLAVLLLIELFYAVLARVLPQLNILIVGVAPKALLAWTALALVMPWWMDPLRRGQLEVFRFWHEVLA